MNTTTEQKTGSKLTDAELRGIGTPGFTVKVTAEQIATAIQCNSGHCMIADAVKVDFEKRFKRKPYGVCVDLQTIRVTDKAVGLRYFYLTPPLAQIQLVNFDQGNAEALKPFSLRLQGGLVTEMKKGTNTTSPSKQKGPALQARWKKSGQTARALNRLKRERKTILKRSKDGKTITRIGGKVPPLAVLSGQRRMFGLNITRGHKAAMAAAAAQS